MQRCPAPLGCRTLPRIDCNSYIGNQTAEFYLRQPTDAMCILAYAFPRPESNSWHPSSVIRTLNRYSIPLVSNPYP